MRDCGGRRSPVVGLLQQAGLASGIAALDLARRCRFGGQKNRKGLVAILGDCPANSRTPARCRTSCGMLTYVIHRIDRLLAGDSERFAGPSRPVNIEVDRVFVSPVYGIALAACTRIVARPRLGEVVRSYLGRFAPEFFRSTSGSVSGHARVHGRRNSIPAYGESE